MIMSPAEGNVTSFLWASCLLSSGTWQWFSRSIGCCHNIINANVVSFRRHDLLISRWNFKKNQATTVGRRRWCDFFDAVYSHMVTWQLSLEWLSSSPKPQNWLKFEQLLRLAQLRRPTAGSLDRANFSECSGGMLLRYRCGWSLKNRLNLHDRERQPAERDFLEDVKESENVWLFSRYEFANDFPRLPSTTFLGVTDVAKSKIRAVINYRYGTVANVLCNGGT